MSRNIKVSSNPEVNYEYVEDLDPNLVCAICQSALIDPVTTTSCKHTFCRDCIERGIAVNPQCPIDRSALTVHSLRDTEQLVKLMLDELKVRCDATGCGKVMQRGLLLAHLRTCPMAIEFCSDPQCGLSMSKQRISEHRAYECFQRKMECGHCGVVLTFKDQTARHRISCSDSDGGASSAREAKCALCNGVYYTSATLHQWSCPAARVPCTHTGRGCPAIVPRAELSSHLHVCPFEALSAFFTANDARLAAMEKTQDRLQAELAALQVRLQTERRSRYIQNESDLVFTLGSPAPPTAPQADPSEPLSPRPRLWSASNQAQPDAATAVPISVDMPVDSDHPQSSLGPTDLHPGVTPRAAADMAAPRSLFSPSFGSRQSYADWAFSQLSDTAARTPRELELANARLRRVVMQLASGLDTMERRNEVRTMTESLRILEEVGALRAIVNSIRMQVMIDRPGTPSFRRFPSITPAASDDGDHETLSGRSDRPTTRNGPSTVAPQAAGREGSSSATSLSALFMNGRARPAGPQDTSRRTPLSHVESTVSIGAVAGEPMGLPPSPSPGISNDQPEPRSSSRLSRAVSNGFLSIRSNRRNQLHGPRL